MTNEILKKEKEFHDNWAQTSVMALEDIIGAFEALTAPENSFILKLLGDFSGKEILDVGCGLGESALYFALKGGKVTALDLSPKMIERCEENAKQMELEIRFLVSPAEELQVDSNSFDIVYSANIIHHVTDKESFLKQVHRVLKPGGLFVAWDPLKYNPLINIYRRIAREVRTEDEKPLGLKDIRLARKFFPDLKHREFWLATLTLFLKYYLVDRKDPNKTRYWKAILRETDQSIGWWFKPFQRVDEWLLKLPLVRLMAWNMVQWGHKP